MVMYITIYMLLLQATSPQPAQPLPASVHHPLTLTLSGRGGGAATNNASPTLCPSFCIFPPSDVVGGASLLSRDLINPALSLPLSLSPSPVDCCRTTGDALSVLLCSGSFLPSLLPPLWSSLLCWAERAAASFLRSSFRPSSSFSLLSAFAREHQKELEGRGARLSDSA